MPKNLNLRASRRQTRRLLIRMERRRAPKRPPTVVKPTAKAYGPRPARTDDERKMLFLSAVTAFDVSEKHLLEVLGVSRSEYYDAITIRTAKSGSMYDDPIWPRLASYVNDRIGALIAVRAELQRKFAKDQRERLERRLMTEQR